MFQRSPSLRIGLVSAALLVFATNASSNLAGQNPLVPVRPKTEQRWFGVMDIEDVRQFRFYLQLTKENGEWQGTLKSLDEGSRDFPMAEVESTAEGLRFTLPGTAATFESTWDPNEERMEGTWTQGGQAFELSFHQVDQCPSRESKVIWKGTLNLLIQKLDVAFVELNSGKWVFDSISQKVGGFYAIDESTEDEIVLRVPAVKGVFRGRYSEDKRELTGKWNQGFTNLDLSMTQASEEDLFAPAFQRSQNPKPPFPYEARDVRFPSKAEGVTLAGTLTLPTESVRAAAILVSGSGAQDRDESLLGHKPFLVIADHFARHGIATLRYDDRGTADSTGDHATATSFDFADDAEGAFRYLSGLPEFGEVPIGFCGHSEGGIIAPIVAARNDDVAFVVLMAGTGVNGKEILFNQSRLILEAEGASDDDIEQNSKVQRALIMTVIDFPDAEMAELETKVEQVLATTLDEEDLDPTERKEIVAAGIKQLANPWFKTFLVLEPKDALQKLRCPVLAINGEKDLQVDPRLNLPAIRAALEKAPTENFEIMEFPGLNHLFQTCETGSVSEYESIEETFNNAALQKMTDWILSIAE